MKCLRILLIIFLIQSIPYVLNANEKDIIKKIKISNEKNVIFPNKKFNLTTLANTNKTNNVLSKKYQRKARGFLAMGITGLALMSLPLTIGLGENLIPYSIMGDKGLDAKAQTYVSFLTIGTSFTLPFFLSVFGFREYNVYKRLRAPCPFFSFSLKKRLFTLGIKLNL